MATLLSTALLYSQQFGNPGLPGNTQANAPIYFQPGSTASDTTSGTAQERPAQDRSGNPTNRYNANRNGSNPYTSVSAQRSASPENALNVPSSTAPQALEVAAIDQFPPGELVAIVGEEPILAADLFSMVDPMLIDAKEKLTDEQFEALREKLVRQSLGKLIQTKMLAQYFVGEQLIGKSLEERKSGKEQINKRMTSAFFEMMMPRMLEQQKVETPLELDRVLRDEGSSVASQMRTFKDSMMAQEAMRKHIPEKFEITAIEMRDRYDEKMEDWQRPARAKFRILTAQFTKTADRNEAERLIIEMGNEALTGGNFEAVARQKSHGSHALDGGRYDWTTQGSLKSTEINDIVFQIPLRRLSQIFEDQDGFHIVEVLDRDPARIVPFEEAQDDIRDSLVEFRKRKAQEKLIEKLQERTTVWSKWPDDVPNAKPLEAYYGVTP